MSGIKESFLKCGDVAFKLLVVVVVVVVSAGSGIKSIYPDKFFRLSGHLLQEDSMQGMEQSQYFFIH